MEKTEIENILLRFKLGQKTLDESTNEILLLLFYVMCSNFVCGIKNLHIYI